MIELNENSILRGNSSTTLAIFDFDDCLVVSDAKIKVIDKKTGKIIKSLTPAQFNNFVSKPNYVLSFDDFSNPEILEHSKIITQIFRFLKNWYSKGIPIAIVTARSSSKLIRNFMLNRGIDIHPDLVIAVSDPSSHYTGKVEERKKQAILELVDNGFKHLIFFDDNAKNLEEAKTIEKIRKDVKVSIYQV